MSDDRWFKSSTWGDEAKLLFRKNLASARHQKFHYLRTKASAIAAEHPSDALALLDEYIAADVEHASGGNYSKSMIYLAQGSINDAVAHLNVAIGKSGLDMHAFALLEFVFLVGLHRLTAYYHRALELLASLDDLAQIEAGRPFSRNFAGNAGAAFILHELGQKDAAKHEAEASLRLALANEVPIPSLPRLGLVPPVSREMLNRLIAIADLRVESATERG